MRTRGDDASATSMASTFRAWVVTAPLALVVTAGCPPPLPDLRDTESDGTETETGDTEGTETETTDTTDTTDTTGEAVCGNGIVEAGENCDDAGPSASCDVDCTDVVCGDSSVNVAAGEDCEGDELRGETCETQGYAWGTLECASNCTFVVDGCELLPGVPTLELSFSPVKQFDFEWTAVNGAEHYRLLESPAPGEPFVQLGGDVVGESISLSMPLYFRFEATYEVHACNDHGCTASSPVSVMGSLAEAVGYFKPSPAPDQGDNFGYSVALSGDGDTLAVGAPYEDPSGDSTGAVYVFVRDEAGQWSQQARVEASNAGSGDSFGHEVALSDDGSTLAVGAIGEDSNATGIDGDGENDLASGAGAVYVFVRDGASQWSQQAYVKASNTGSADYFGYGVALSGDGDTLAVGAYSEDSNATGIDGDDDNDLAGGAGAVYVLVRDGASQWSQQAYVKASNTDPGDYFGYSVALSRDGDTLAVGADSEDSNATGIDGDEDDDTSSAAGAVYVFARDGASQWAQQAYVKASNTDPGDAFGRDVALSGAGDTLAVGAPAEDGAGLDEQDDSAGDAGAVYVFVRDGASPWVQQAYVKASNIDPGDTFGHSVALSDDGDALAVGAVWERSMAVGIDGDAQDDSGFGAGAVYVLLRDATDAWSHQAYVKASNTDAGDLFGHDVALSDDRNTLAVGAIGEDGEDDSENSAGAVYLY